MRVGHPHWGLSQISETANSQRNNVQCGCTHPQCGSVTRTGDLDKFQKMKVYTGKPPSAAAPTRSAGRPPALGYKITIQKKSEASADALDSSAGQSIRSAGQPTRSAGQSTRTQHLVRFSENSEDRKFHECGCITRSAGQLIRSEDLDEFWKNSSNTEIQECGCAHPQCG